MKDDLIQWLLTNRYDAAMILFALEYLVSNPPKHGERWIREAKIALDKYDAEVERLYKLVEPV